MTGLKPPPFLPRQPVSHQMSTLSPGFDTRWMVSPGPLLPHVGLASTPSPQAVLLWSIFIETCPVERLPQHLEVGFPANSIMKVPQ